MARKAPDQDAGEALRRFKSDLKAGTLGNFYIISGEEAFLRSHYVDLITKKIADGPAGEFNCHRFSADDCTPQALADAIDAMPMMAERTLVRVDDVDLFKQPEGAREQYAAIFSDLPDYCCVLFVYDTVEFKINGTMKKLAAAIREHAQILTFGKQSERDLCAWITRHFRAHDKMVTDDLCQYLIFRTDGLMTTLAGEIDKIAAYQQGPAITRGAIDAVVIPALSAQTFDISDAVVNRDFEKALFKLQELYAMQTDPIVVLGAIGAQLRRLYYARVILSSGGGQKELMEALSGLRAADGGTITFKEKNITKTTVRQRISDGLAFIPEDRYGFALVRELSVAENASIKSYRLPEFSKGGIVDYKKLNKQAEEFIDKFEIKVGGTKSLVQSMSGGNAQKLILARETASKPDVILASYPVRGLDIKATESIHKILVNEKNRGAGVLLVSEDFDEIFQLCDRVAVMYEGKFMGIVPISRVNLETIGLAMSGAARMDGEPNA